MFVFGGYNGEKVTNDLWHFELGSMVVRQIGLETPLPEPRARHSIHIIEGLLHVPAGTTTASRARATSSRSTSPIRPVWRTPPREGTTRRRRRRSRRMRTRIRRADERGCERDARDANYVACGVSLVMILCE